MSNLGQMIANIEGYLARSDLTSYVRNGINRAIRKYSKTRWWFDEAETTINTVAGTQSYSQAALVSPVKNVNYLRLTVSGVYYELQQRDINYILSANVNNNQSQPTDWAWWKQSIYFYPTPNNVYVVTMYYHKTYATLVNNADTNDWTEIPEAEELIENETLRWMYEKVILDKEKTMQYKQAARESYNDLVSMNNQLTGMEGGIRPTDW